MNFYESIERASDIKIPEGSVSEIRDSQGHSLWRKSSSSACLKFKSSSEFKIVSYNGDISSTVAKYWDGIVEYSRDGRSWSVWNGSEVGAGSDNEGNYSLYFRGTGNHHINTRSSYARWSIAGGMTECSGNIETLLDYKTVERGDHPEMDEFCYRSLFYDCYFLTTPPELPATNLTAGCYYAMFRNTKLTICPELPATQLVKSCYFEMFFGCSSIITPPKLPATQLADFCYSEMFGNCLSMEVCPKLPATILAEQCYRSMFAGCRSIKLCPELPATELVEECYGGMFQGCSMIENPPKLPAKILAVRCYNSMFSSCSNLKSCPELPAETLAAYCYANMFYGCGNIKDIPELLATTLVEGCYYRMFFNCSSIGFSTKKTGAYQIPWRIPKSGTGSVSPSTVTNWDQDMIQGTSGTFTGNPVMNTTYYTTGIASSSFIKFWCQSSFSIASFSGASSTIVRKYWNGTIQYSTDSVNWTNWGGELITATGTDQYGYTLYFRGEGNTHINTSSAWSRWQIESNENYVFCYGNIENILDYKVVQRGEHPAMDSYCYYNMFRAYSSSYLRTPPELGAKTLSDYCYENMFFNNEKLYITPRLPSTELAEACYRRMFYSCWELSSLPELPSTQLKNACYYGMFYNAGSSSIGLHSQPSSYYRNEYRIPSSGEGVEATDCFTYMFYGASGEISTPEINVSYYTSAIVI